MAKVKSEGTKLEMVVRQLLFSMGYRYMLQDHSLSGSPDNIFKSQKKVIFVHGCFWRRHDGCPLARLSKSLMDFCIPELEGNRERDICTLHQLKSLGWEVLVIWECELKDLNLLEKMLNGFLGRGNMQ